MAEHVRRGIAYQIRALRDQAGMAQGTLAAQLKKPQSVVSRFEDPKYGKVTVQTLLEVAKAFDVAVQVRFVSFSQFLRDNEDRTSMAMRVDSFLDDIAITHAGAPTGSAMGDAGNNEILKIGNFALAESGTDGVIRREPVSVIA